MYISENENPSHKAQLKSRCGKSSPRNNSSVHSISLMCWANDTHMYTKSTRRRHIVLRKWGKLIPRAARSRAAKEAIKQNVKLKMNYWAQIKNKSLCPGELPLILLRGAFIIFYAGYLHVTTTHTPFLLSLSAAAGRPAALENLLILYFLK